jgi:hypothetical protein
MTYYFIVLATIRPILQQALFKYNLMSGVEEEAPPGWYRDVASLIPVNRRTGLLIAAGATYLKRVAEGEKRKLDLDTTDVRTCLSFSPSILIALDHYSIDFASSSTLYSHYPKG